MTKKHFIALVDTVKDIKARKCNMERTIELLADFCQSTNSNFKRDRWIDYINGLCGKNGGKVK